MKWLNTGVCNTFEYVVIHIAGSSPAIAFDTHNRKEGEHKKKWCDKYDLVKSHDRGASGVTCIELGFYFKTFKEAAEYMISNGYSNATNIWNLSYKISNAKSLGIVI